MTGFERKGSEMTGYILKKLIPEGREADCEAVRSAVGAFSGGVGIAANLVLFLGKLLAGILSGSVGVVADALNNLSDASGSILTLVGFRLADKPADAHHPFGHARAEYLSGLAVAVLVLFILFYHRLFAITFDENFSRATGLKVGRYNSLLAILTALTIVLGMRMMGAMLISSLVIFPALTAMRAFRSFRGVVLCAAAVSVVCFCAGLTVSFAFSTPVGATVVAANLTVFLLSCCVGLLRRGRIAG
jgi:cation diffusion facilitator family transporter